MSLAFFSHDFSAHTLEGHPEHAGRLEAVLNLLRQQSDLWSALMHLSAEPASDAQLQAVHTPRYLAHLVQTRGLSGRLDPDTYFTPQSEELARLAAGGACAVVSAVLNGQARQGIVATRPPGHHATPHRAMGFCLYNTVAIAARHAQNAHGLPKVAIVDIDVHHGNGTQDAFYSDPSILFVSSHQSPLYPGTGDLNEIGAGAGEGYTVNLPLPAYTGDLGYQRVYEGVVLPTLERFQADLLLVSVGFDAHHADPLAQMRLSWQGFDALIAMLIAYAEAYCGGKVVFVMEGGYDLHALSHGWLNIVRRLAGQAPQADRYGLAREEKPLSVAFLARLQAAHGLG
jgi:acetoin utilization deacetylase AcuC-like enzyme